MVEINTGKRTVEIDVCSTEFLDGYSAGSEHPAFLIGNTLEKAPESDDINPYKVDSNQYWYWRSGFETAIL